MIKTNTPFNVLNTDKKSDFYLPLPSLQYFADDQDDNGDDAGDSGADDKDDDHQDDNSDDKGDPEKKYTQEDFEKEIARRIANEKKLADEKVEEAKKLAKMNADQKREYEYEKLQKELDEYKKKDAYHSLSKEAANMLSDNKITADDELLSFVVKETAEETQKAVKSFVGVLNQKVEEGVKQALSGKSPKVNSKAGEVLTKEKIMGIKDSGERIKAIQANPQLFKQKGE